MPPKIQPRVPRGMRDILPQKMLLRQYVIGQVEQVFQRFGFEPLQTPVLELSETLMGKYGEEGNQLIFKILKRGEKLDINDKELAYLALRYDLTVPLARVVANYRNDLPKFFKRYQIQPVWRADRPARGGERADAHGMKQSRQWCDCARRTKPYTTHDATLPASQVQRIIARSRVKSRWPGPTPATPA